MLLYFLLTIKVCLKKLQLAPRSERFSEAFIGATLAVSTFMLSVPVVAGKLWEFDNEKGVEGPLNSVYKLDKIQSRCKQNKACYVF